MDCTPISIRYEKITKDVQDPKILNSRTLAVFIPPGTNYWLAPNERIVIRTGLLFHLPKNVILSVLQHNENLYYFGLMVYPVQYCERVDLHISLQNISSTPVFLSQKLEFAWLSLTCSIPFEINNIS